jgi:hypothetical protein
MYVHDLFERANDLGSRSVIKYAFRSSNFAAWCVMARKKISTTIYITPEQNESLKLLHERTKVPIAVYIREGIDLVLERHSSELPGQLTLVAAGDKKG